MLKYKKKGNQSSGLVTCLIAAWFSSRREWRARPVYQSTPKRKKLQQKPEQQNERRIRLSVADQHLMRMLPFSNCNNKWHKLRKKKIRKRKGASASKTWQESDSSAGVWSTFRTCGLGWSSKTRRLTKKTHGLMSARMASSIKVACKSSMDLKLMGSIVSKIYGKRERERESAH